MDDDPLSQFSLSIFRLNGFLMRNGDAITKPLKQSSARWQVLGRVGFRPQTVAQIARSMGHTRQSVQRIADTLVREGLVTYKDHPSDRRTRILELTPTGLETLTAIYTQYGAWTRHIMSKLTARQLSQLATALNEVAEVLEADQYHKGSKTKEIS